MESQQKSNTNLVEQLRLYPKVELHRHLEGALRFSTLVELAKRMGQDVPADVAGQKNKFLVLEPMKDLMAVLNKFMATQAVLDSEAVLTRITYEAIDDAYKEGIRILELRYAPTFIMEGHPGLSFEKIHQAIVRGVERAQHMPIAVGLLCIFQRTQPLKDLERVLDFVIDTRDTWIGVDLADDEAGFPASMFSPLFARAAKAGLPITIHAGEVPLPVSPQNVWDAIHTLGARRIGHGLQIINDEKTLQEVVKTETVLELCPTSNWLTQGVKSLDAHPFRKLMEAGVLTTINSDDPGVFGIDLTNEYQLLAKSYSLTHAEFDRCNDIAAAASFIPLVQKQKCWPRKIQS